jgi:hypothetical protein
VWSDRAVAARRCSTSNRVERVVRTVSELAGLAKRAIAATTTILGDDTGTEKTDDSRPPAHSASWTDHPVSKPRLLFEVETHSVAASVARAS